MSGVPLIVREVELRTRPVSLRLPFRFGGSTLTACPQLFVRAVVEVPGRGRATGWSAEMMVPRWFDKRADRTADDNIDDLARATRDAADAMTNDAPATAFGLHARHEAALMTQGSSLGRTALSTAFGQAVLDKAIVDGLCRALGISFFDAARSNAIGLADTALAADLAGWDWDGWMAGLQPLRRIEARHTIGLLDELDAVQFDDGPGMEGHAAGALPVSLRAVIRHYGHRSFKIKLGGQPADDLRRLDAVLDVLDDEVGRYRYTVDGNEQYADLDALGELLLGLRQRRTPMYVEQPLPRDLSFSQPLPAMPELPLLMDEADATTDAFLRGRALGWRGVSSKACKGLYKSLINRARCDAWNRDTREGGTFFMSAEDLTCQAGLAVQQDLALVALLGITHSERNGHHYGRGFASAPAEEARAFASAHPDLYTADAHEPLLRITDGVLAIDSLSAPGYAHGADPDWRATQPLTIPKQELH